jgi:hypothetical protein
MRYESSNLEPYGSNIVMTILCWLEQHWIDLLTTAGTIATALIIWRQAYLLNQQNQVNALIELQRDWESHRMHSLRSSWAWAPTERTEELEPILEFLEEFAGFRKRKVLNDELIWDTMIGWHAARYYFYNLENGNIDKFRKDWVDGQIFQNLEQTLWPAYVRNESKQNKKFHGAAAKSEDQVKEELRNTMSLFLEREKAL